MDYLQEGINLRAMGQKDPLTEWQREGFEMFGMMMKGIAQDLVRYVMHVQVQVQQPADAAAGASLPGVAAATPAIEAPVQNLQYSAPDDSASGGGNMVAAATRAAVDAGGAAPAAAAAPAATMTPTVKTDWDKTPRNAPCPCGSGKKFKLCHGKA
jgi:preprotein translocase subunit SecA